MINNSKNVTHNAALDNDATNTNTAMADAATDLSPHQDLPQHKFNNHSYRRKMFSATIQNPLRTTTLPPKNLHNHVDPKINFRAPNSQDNTFPQRTDYNLFNQTDFPPLPFRFPLATQQHVEIDNLTFKLHSFSGNPDQDAEEFLNNFKLAANVLSWTFDKQPGIFICVYKVQLRSCSNNLTLLPAQILKTHFLLFF